MGSRRTHEEAAVAAARAAYLVGFASTSNLEAGRRYGVPTTGTSAHAFTLLHDDEESAFRAQVAALGSRDDAAGRHLRRRAGHPDGGRGRRAPSWAPSGWTPATCRRSPPAPASCSTSSARRGPGSSSPATSTSTPSPASWPPRSTATASARRWSPAPAPRRWAWSTSWSSATACRWPRSPRARSRSAGARPPSAGTTRRHRDRRGGQQRPRRAARDGDRDLVVPLVKGGQLIDPADPVPRPWPARGRTTREVRAALPQEAWALSRGEPALDTVTA